MNRLPGVTLKEGSVAFRVDETIHSLEAIQGTCHIFVDRCFLHLSRPADQQVEVTMAAFALDEESDSLSILAGEFSNELLNQSLRLRVSESDGWARSHIFKRAFGGGRGANIESILAELDATELAEDPLEISVPDATEPQRVEGPPDE